MANNKISKKEMFRDSYVDFITFNLETVAKNKHWGHTEPKIEFKKVNDSMGSLDVTIIICFFAIIFAVSYFS